MSTLTVKSEFEKCRRACIDAFVLLKDGDNMLKCINNCDHVFGPQVSITHNHVNVEITKTRRPSVGGYGYTAYARRKALKDRY